MKHRVINRRGKAWISSLLTCSLLGMAGSVEAEVRVFRLSPMCLVSDDAVPNDLEPLNGPVSLRIAPGQLDDLVLAATGGKQTLQGVRVIVGPLRGPDKRLLEIPEERIRTVACYYGPKGGIGGPPDWDAKESYVYEPSALLYDASLIRPNHAKRRTEITYRGLPDDNPPLKPRDVPAGELRQWYVTIPIPEKTLPGAYQGQFSFLSGDVEIAAVDLLVEVLPIRLLPSAKLYGMYTNLQPGFAQQDPRYSMILTDLAEHGFHNPWLIQGQDRVTVGGVSHDFFTNVEKDMELRYRAGLDMDFVLWASSGIALHVGNEPGYHQQFVEGNRTLARQLADYWKLRPEFPPLVIYGYDELHGEPLRELAHSTYKALIEAGLNVGAACSPGFLDFTDRWMNYPILAGSLIADAQSKSDAARARSMGATILTYSDPQLIYHDPFLYRLRTGFNLWTSIYDGWFPFTYAWSYAQHEDGTIVTTGRTANFKAHGVVLLGKNRIIPQVEWPAMRQGVDDVRYATTLAAQVMMARESGIKDPKVDEAERLVRQPLAAGVSPQGVEKARERLAEAILDLQRLDARLETGKLGGKSPKLVARKVNHWILPNLSFREFPMGLVELGQKWGEMEQQAKNGKAFEATMLGYSIEPVLTKALAAGQINDVELSVAKGKIGTLLLEQEKKCLEIIGDAYKQHFDLVRDVSDGWRFRPDRDDLGVPQEWFKPGASREGWKAIDVRKFWQQQGEQDWVQLEGPRVGMMGIGWYALKLDVPADWNGRALYLWFNSDEDAMIWVNGTLVRVRDEGGPSVRWHTPSLAPLKEALKPGQQNEIVARVYNMAQAGGLWRGVRIIEPKK